jgi:hypothetical protein
MKIERLFKKLNHKMIDLFKILKMLRQTCQLKLSSSMKVQNTFYISLLRRDLDDSLNDQIQSFISLVIIDEKKKMNES